MNQECNNQRLAQESHEQQHQQLEQERNILNNDNNNITSSIELPNKMIMNTRPSVELNSLNDHNEFLRATTSLSSVSSSMLPSPSSKTATIRSIANDNTIHSSSSSSNSHAVKLVYGKPTNLGIHFQPGPYDCICGRGKVAFNHVGNKYFRSLIELARNSYLKAETKIQRSFVVSGVVDAVRAKGTGFVKQIKASGEWIEVGDHLAREKVGQSLRETLATKYKSSHKAKKYRRKETSTKVNQTLEEIIHTNTNISTIIQNMTRNVVTIGHTSTSSSATTRTRTSTTTLDDDFLLPDPYQEQQQQQQQQQSDEEIMKLFNESNSQILAFIKQDQPMVQRFQEAYVNSSKKKNSNGSGNDSSDNDDSNSDLGGIMMMEYESIPSSWME